MAEIVCCYGSSGSFKTAQILFLAKYAYKRWRKLTRLASCDGGGWKPLEPAIEAKLIEAWNVSAIENPRSVLRKLSQGYWPKVVTAPGKPAHLVLQDDVQTVRDRIGVMAFEGLTSVANIIMRDALNKQLIVAGDQAGSKGPVQFDETVTLASLGGTETQTKEKYSFATPGNYNDAQRAVYDFCTNTRSLPCPLVYWSALEARGEEEDTKKTIIGPAVVGKAMTSQVGAWVGDLIHLEDYYEEQPDPLHKLTDEDRKRGVRQRVKQITKVRAWFIRHPDSITGMLFPAKPRVAPNMIPKLLEVYPGGYFEPTTEAGIDAYLEVVDKLQGEASTGLAGWMKSIDEAREAGSKVGGTDAAKADPKLVAATTGGKP